MLREEKLKFARQFAAEGMVLLKNNGVLPLKNNENISLFGIASYRCFRMGWGSGDMLAQKIVQIDEGLLNAGFTLNQSVKEAYDKWVDEHAKEYEHINRNWFEWTFRFNEAQIDKTIIENASKETDIAVITIGRCSGESDDLKNEEGFMKLHSEETDLIREVSKQFKHTILLLNVCGVIDLTSIDDCNIDSIVYVSLGGEQIGNGVADVISGKINPSAKLTTTWAYKYEDYPTKEGITTLTVPYNEGIYVGYRYFDTFGIEPRYHFGYGLSYTDFNINVENVRLDGPIVDISVKVKNTGKVAGREVVQCYLSQPEVKLEKAYQELCAYTKTDIIEAGEEKEVVLSFDITDMASFDTERASFILEAGKYIVRVGNSSRNTHVASIINIDKEIVCSVVTNRVKCNENLDLLSNKKSNPYTYNGEKEEINKAKILTLDANSIEKLISSKYEDRKVPKFECEGLVTLQDVLDGKATVENLVANFSDEELSCLLNGVIYDGADANANVGSMSSKVRGAAGEMWSSEKYKIPVNAVADGPSGIRLSIFGTDPNTDTEICKNVVAYPSGTCLANSWDLESARKFGECVRSDLEYSDIEGWLAPGINIHRNPLNGRNFEYYSEDPLIAGKIGANVTIGVQYDDNAELTGKYTTIKHFACNNIAYERGVSDSVVSERALREIYLKGFKIAIEEANPFAVMTSYNKINGTFASTNFDLLNGILRGEWEYDGMVMTDWNTCANPKEHTHAGNDLIMPGCHRKKIVEGLSDGTITKSDAMECAARIIRLIIRSNFKIKD